MRLILIAVLFALTSCSGGKDKNPYDEYREQEERANVPGRYQMELIPGEKAVFVLDTAGGLIRRCAPIMAEAEGEFLPMGCGPGAKQ